MTIYLCAVSPPQLAAVDAFFAAARGGDLEALIAVIHPDVVPRSDSGALAKRQPQAQRELLAIAAVAVLLILLASGGSSALFLAHRPYD